MTQYIIGAVSDLDVPMNPAAKGLYSLSAYITGLDNATLQRERDELLAVTEEDIRALSAHIRAFMQEDLLCVVSGSAHKDGNPGRRQEALQSFLLPFHFLPDMYKY